MPCENLLKWARWYETADRTVAQSMVGATRVSTVFLALDHGFLNNLPVLFETMVFGGPLDRQMKRYSTWLDAEKGHLEMVARVVAAQEVGVIQPGQQAN